MRSKQRWRDRLRRLTAACRLHDDLAAGCRRGDRQAMARAMLLLEGTLAKINQTVDWKPTTVQDVLGATAAKLGSIFTSLPQTSAGDVSELVAARSAADAAKSERVIRSGMLQAELLNAITRWHHKMLARDINQPGVRPLQTEQASAQDN